MKRNKKKFILAILLCIALIPLASFAHYIIFPQETRSLLVFFSGFKKEGNLYYKQSSSGTFVEQTKSLIASATDRVTHFWGSKISTPVFIYCEQLTDFKKYSINPDAPAVTYCKLGEHIVLSQQGMDLDIISHEISHAELYARVGFYIWTFKIPDWFKHGLAMQNDYRNYYSVDTLKARTDHFKTMPDITRFKTSAQFYSGTTEQVMIRYMTAKYFIGNWYSKEKLDRLILDLNSGKYFDNSFKN